MIYSTENEGIQSIRCENRSDDVESKFVDEIVQLIIKSLSVGYREERIVSSLLRNQLKDKLDTRYKNEGLLQQYEAYVLDKSSKRIIETFTLESKINHDNATHAKFADIVKELETKIKNNEQTI